jgi:hypothetical protein
LAIVVDLLERIADVWALTGTLFSVVPLVAVGTGWVDASSGLLALDFWCNADAVTTVVVTVGTGQRNWGTAVIQGTDGVSWLESVAFAASVISGTAEWGGDTLVEAGTQFGSSWTEWSTTEVVS